MTIIVWVCKIQVEPILSPGMLKKNSVPYMIEIVLTNIPI